jgi:hypothetical protein
MSGMECESAGRGRPRRQRLKRPDADWLKTELVQACGSLAKFYQQAFDEARRAKFKDFKQPKNVETVDRAFDAFLSGSRSLPELYWMILAEHLGIGPDDLPSRARIVAKPNANLHPAAAQEEIESSPVQTSFRNSRATEQQHASNSPPPDSQSSPSRVESSDMAGPPKRSSDIVRSALTNEKYSASQSAHMRALHPKRSEKAAWRAHRVFTDWFRELSLDSAIDYLGVMGKWKTERQTAMHGEVLKWECGYSLAQKLANTDTMTYGFFYAGCSGIPEEVKREVSAIIAADRRLERAFRRNFKRTDDYLSRLYEWFTESAEYYPSLFGQSFQFDLEDLAKSLKFMKYLMTAGGVETLTNEIAFYGENGFDYIAKAMIGLCLKDNLALLDGTARTEHGRRAVIEFSGTARQWMTTEEARRVQEFLMQRGLVKRIVKTRKGRVVKYTGLQGVKRASS